MDISHKHVVVVGVSQDPEKYGHRIFADMVATGWYVDGIHPKGGEVAGKPIYPSLAQVPEKIDMIITVVSPAVTEGVVEEAYQLGITSIWMQPGSESQTAIKKAEDYGMTVTHNACIMVRTGIWKRGAAE